MFGLKFITKKEIQEFFATLKQIEDKVEKSAVSLEHYKAEIEWDFICGGWTTADIKQGLIISKRPDGYYAAFYTPPLNRKRVRLMRVIMRVEGDELKAAYNGVDHTVTLDPNEESIEFPGLGTFFRDEDIFM